VNFVKDIQRTISHDGYSETTLGVYRLKRTIGSDKLVKITHLTMMIS
jgi:hypothetical protein